MCANEKKTPTAYDQFVSYVPTNIVKVSVEMTVDCVVQLVELLHKDTFHACVDTYASQSCVTDCPPGETFCFINHRFKATSMKTDLFYFSLWLIL